MRNTWDLSIRLGWIIGLALVIITLGATVALVVFAAISPISIWTFVMSIGALITMTLALRLIYQLWGLINASYEMDRNAVIIHWGSTHYQIPMVSVRRVLSGADIEGTRIRLGVRWPGYFVGLGQAEEIGPILFYATRPLAQQVIICTEGMAYAISPNDLTEFLQAFGERLDMGPTQEVEELSTHPAFLNWEIWRDRVGLLTLTGSFLLLLLLVGLLCWRYPYLPPEIATRFTPTGDPLLTVQASRIFYFALMGTGFLFLNTILGFLLYHRERRACYFLWSGMLAIQSILWIAVVAILLQQ